jgi:hypothetical protein
VQQTLGEELELMPHRFDGDVEVTPRFDVHRSVLPSHGGKFVSRLFAHSGEFFAHGGEFVARLFARGGEFFSHRSQLLTHLVPNSRYLPPNSRYLPPNSRNLFPELAEELALHRLEKCFQFCVDHVRNRTSVQRERNNF